MRALALPVLLAGLALAGCAPLLAPSPRPTDRSVELTTVPFFPQTRFQCGPAALATVLQSTGVEVSTQELVDAIYLPGRRGSLQDEISAASRRYGRVPFVVDGGEEGLVDELRAGHPVLILQNLGLSALPRWHYAVVVGYRAEGAHWVLRSGRQRRLLMSPRRFSGSWARADRWGLVLLPPGELPARASARGTARTLAEAQAVLGAGTVLPSWKAALSRWSDEADLAFGAGNAARGADDLSTALTYYQRALAIDAGHLATRNNLADLELERGCARRALEIIGPALDMADAADPLRPTLAETAAAARRAVEAGAATPDSCR